ncbi:unnamed protein product [Owenia fusiformis]|uniref:Corticotropin-releasing factor-binding protein n=1 Tax=Owenia fusiformis TaxID=6347 RepID=A0A8J1TWJ4_OWEFU|nr:unnamed protein product [Owenia fusiformis]
MLRIFISFYLFNLCLSTPLQKKADNLLTRHARSVAGREIGCTDMDSVPGDYIYSSIGGQQVCGFFLIGLTDQLVEIEFTSFNIGCQDGGLLSIVDGWELQGQYFPSEQDHQVPIDSRFNSFCGEDAPKKFYISSQNVALLQFRIPVIGQGFQVKVNFPQNPEPCNAVSIFQEGEYTLSNYGKRRNCSLSIIYPERIEFEEVNVGSNPDIPMGLRRAGTIERCRTRKGGDYVEVRDGNGMDPMTMWKVGHFCGMETPAGALFYDLGCQHSVVREYRLFTSPLLKYEFGIFNPSQRQEPRTQSEPD